MQTISKKKVRKRKKAKEEAAPARVETPSVIPEVPLAKKEEVPAEVVVKPPTPESLRVSEEDEVLAYLKKYGASGPGRIVRSLGMDWPTVMKALKKLRDEGKIDLG